MSLRSATLALLAGLGAAALNGGPAAAAEHTLFIYETPAGFAARTDPAKASAYWSAFADYGKAMAQAGVLRGGSAVQASGAVVGPIKAPAAREQLSGYFVIDVADLAAAAAWAAKAPGGADTARIEVRPNVPMMAQ